MTSPQEAFVAFADEAFFPLLRVLIDSVEAFSTRPIIAYGINADLPWPETPQLITRRIDARPRWWRSTFQIREVWRLKSRAIFESNLSRGVYVDSDSVLNRGIDQLFDWSARVGSYPLCPRHPQDPDNQQHEMRELGVTAKSMPYVHAHVIFAASCRPFLEEWDRECERLAPSAPVGDETVLNVLLWKHGARDYLPAYDPYFATIDDFYAGRPPAHYGPECDVRPLIFHGCKDPLEARTMLERLQRDPLPAPSR